MGFSNEKRVRLLIVDDEEHVTEMLEEFLTFKGHEVFRAKDGEQAISIMDNDTFDLVITDIFMPKVDGMQLIAHIRTNAPSTDVIAMTGLFDQVSYNDVIQAGAIDYMAKPFSFEELEAKLHRVFRERNILKKLQKELADKAETEKQLEARVKEKTAELSSNLESLARSEARFRSVVETAIDGIITCDKHGQVMAWNKSAGKIFGYTSQEMINENIVTIIPEHLRDKHQAGMKRVVECGEKKILGTIYETEGKHKNGNQIPIEISLTISSEKDLCFTGIIRDISERKNADDALSQSEENVRLLLEHTVEAIYGLDLEGCCTFANPSCVKMLGYTSQDDIVGQNTHELFHYKWPDNSPYRVEDCKIYQAYRKRTTTHADDEVFWRKDGTSVPVEYWSHPIYQNGQAVGSVVTFVDISARKIAEQEKTKLEKKLQQAHKMEAIGTLAGGIAHDFNNILGSILGYADMAKEDAEPGSSIARDLDQVLKSSYRAKELVKQILSFSRQSEEEKYPFQPAPIVKEALKILRPSIPTTIDIRQDIDTKTSTILADPTNVHQILINICTNAFHAMEETGGELSITLKEISLDSKSIALEPGVMAGNYIKLSIADTGEGIDPTIKNKVFDPYFTTKDTGKGTGMGLAIVHGIVKSCGGFINLESEPGKGTTFHVFLPIYEREVVYQEKIQEKIPLGHERVLFIDDEEMLVEMGQDMLQRLGYKVTVCNKSLEALELFKESPDQFDVVITDQTMPKMTGADLAVKLLAVRSDIPIILCTGYSSIVDAEKAMDLGISEFILKPIVKRDIAKLIRKVLENKLN